MSASASFLLSCWSGKAVFARLRPLRSFGGTCFRLSNGFRHRARASSQIDEAQAALRANLLATPAAGLAHGLEKIRDVPDPGRDDRKSETRRSKKDDSPSSSSSRSSSSSSDRERRRRRRKSSSQSSSSSSSSTSTAASRRGRKEKTLLARSRCQCSRSTRQVQELQKQS